MKKETSVTCDLVKNAAPIVFALIVSAGFFTCIFFMLNKTYPPENKDALNSLLGVLTTIFTLQMNFFFGSSASNKAKDETIFDIAKSTPTGSGGGGIGQRATDKPIPANDIDIVAKGDVTIEPEKPKGGGNV